MKGATRISSAILACGLAGMVVTGCTPAVEPPAQRQRTEYGRLPVTAPEPPATPAEPVKPSPQILEIGRSVNNRPITAEIYGQGEHTVLIIATIHGNETAGTPLVGKLGEYLLENPGLIEGKQVIIVPVANPDGMSANRRTNSRGVDLNRNFPAWNYSATRKHGSEPLSEPESQALHDLILRYPPIRIISIHQPLNCIDYDGPAEGLARAMASSSRLPLKKLGSLAGSLGSFAGITLKTPIITVEFARSADELSAETMWQRYGRMLLVGICYPDSVRMLASNSQHTNSEASPVDDSSAPADSASGN